MKFQMFGRVAGVALALVTMGLLPAQAKGTNSKAALKVAEDMVQAWNQLDLDKIVNTFSEDGVLQSMMTEPVKGRKALREHLAGLIAGATRLELKLKNVAATGNTVFLERVDDFDFKGHHGAVPVVGVMEISGGKVKVWREYYDQASLLRAMGVEPAPAK